MITFKSVPSNFEKEKDGRKPNTMRKVDWDDARFMRLAGSSLSKPPTRVRIINTETLESFTREITDITFWDGWCIISWKNEDVIAPGNDYPLPKEYHRLPFPPIKEVAKP